MNPSDRARQAGERLAQYEDAQQLDSLLRDLAERLSSLERRNGLFFDPHDERHAASHEVLPSGTRNPDALVGLLDANGRVMVKNNAGVDFGPRRRIHLIQGANMTITVEDVPNLVGYDEEIRITLAAAGGGGGAHSILSATHSDSLPAAVVDGDVIIGNVTPVWSRLAVVVPAANVRNVFGIDNGELRPSWKTALDATSPAAVAAAASPGTSLVFSHRDHVHGHGSGYLPDAHHSQAHSRTDHTTAVRVQDEGGPFADVLDFNFVGAGVTASVAAGVATVTIPGGGGAAHTILDGSTHTDSVVQTVSRGSLIYGNATPKWDELVVGAAGSILRADGTDPAWTINPTIAGYTRIGSALAPTNVTAGDLTATRLFIGADAALLSGLTAQVAGNLGISGSFTLRLYRASNAFYTAHNCHPLRTSDILYTWPLLNPIAGQVLSNNGVIPGAPDSAALVWTTPIPGDDVLALAYAVAF